MIKCLFRRQWKKAAWFIIAFCTVLLLQDGMENQWVSSLLPYQQAYMEQLDLSQKEAFFQQLDADVEQTNQLYNAIERYEDYDGQIPEGEMDLLDFLSGSAYYADYDMLLWRDQMLQMPGRLSDTVQNDRFMTRWLAERLTNQKNFADIIENHKETMRRGIRRGGSAAVRYSYTLEQLESINQNFAVAETYYAEQLLSYLQADWYILVILALSVFGVFASGNQQKVSNVVLISPMGFWRFAWKQILSSILIAIVCLALYYPIVTIICCNGDLSAIPWQHPIQVLLGYENILKNMTILEYFLINIGIKVLFCLLLVSVVLYVSAWSPNNIVSLLATAAICGSLILMNRSGGSLAGLWIGNSNALHFELCYIFVNGRLIDYSLVYSLGLLLATAVVCFLTILQGGFAARKWVK